MYTRDGIAVVFHHTTSHPIDPPPKKINEALDVVACGGDSREI